MCTRLTVDRKGYRTVLAFRRLEPGPGSVAVVCRSCEKIKDHRDCEGLDERRATPNFWTRAKGNYRQDRKRTSTTKRKELGGRRIGHHFPAVTTQRRGVADGEQDPCRKTRRVETRSAGRTQDGENQRVTAGQGLGHHGPVGKPNPAYPLSRSADSCLERTLHESVPHALSCICARQRPGTHVAAPFCHA